MQACGKTWLSLTLERGPGATGSKMPISLMLLNRMLALGASFLPVCLGLELELSLLSLVFDLCL